MRFSKKENHSVHEEERITIKHDFEHLERLRKERKTGEQKWYIRRKR